MDQSKNIAMTFQRLAEAGPDTPAIRFPEARYSRAQVWRLAQTFAIRMREAGVDRGATVCIDADETLVVLSTVLASALLGARFVQQAGRARTPGNR